MKTVAKAAVLLILMATAAFAAEIQLTGPQQEAANKLKAKGGLVMQLAADSDALVVGLAQAGKSATDDDLVLVKSLPKVAELNLAGTGITDAGLTNLEGMSTLTELHLEKTGITDAGLAHLKGLDNLTYLNLYATAVTDQGVAQLNGLKKLKRVYLWQTKVSADGAKVLKTALPEVVVNRGEELTIVVPKPAEPAPAAKPPVVAVAAKPINTKCPVSGKAVDAQFTLVHEGKVIGFCCNMCPEDFKKDPKKFIDKVVADAAHAKDTVKDVVAAKPPEKPAPVKPADEKPAVVKAPDIKPAEKPAEKPAADAVATKSVNAHCPLSGDEVDSRFTFAFDGKLIGFCCKDCLADFKKEPQKYISKVKSDGAPEKQSANPEKAPANVLAVEPPKTVTVAIARPVNTKCPLSGHAVDPAFTFVFEGKVIGLCCEDCLADFKKDPKRYAAKIIADAKP